MSSYKMLAIVFVASLAGGLVWSTNHYHGKYQDTRLQVAEHEKTLAQQVGLIDTLQAQDTQNRALMAAQQQREQELRQQNEIYQRKYREAIKYDACAGIAAPGAVFELLRGAVTADTRDDSATAS